MPLVTELSDTQLAVIRRQVGEFKGWFIAVGVLLAVLGVVAIALPIVSTVAAVIWMGWVLLIGGAVIVLHALLAWRWPDSVWSFLIGLLYLAAGALILYAPLTGVLSLTIVMAVLFMVEGFIEIVQAFRLRPLEGWGWLLFSGLAALAAGVLMAYQLPVSAAWALGLLLGLNLLSTGLSFVFLGLACRGALATPNAQREFGNWS